MNKTIYSTIITAILASLCCIGPLAVLFLGSTSIGLFSIFEPLRPIFGILSVITLVIAYSKIFKEGKADCCNTEELKKSFSKQKRILKSITPIVFVLLAFPYFTAGLHGDNTGDQSGMKSEWVIEGMTCEGCAAGMEGALTATDGMNSCNVSYEKGIMICYTDKSKLSRNEISVLVNRNGFKAVVKTEKPSNEKG
ncbi:MAG: hypothetical protein HOB40_06535 [Candidatus Marinimicrobia bacterium]|jgi:mercuric ion transport protein|nr:hypothetical protein [Candidatus Neomarinimicrobiota bacterium]MBT4635899.1 hypothetical protein [Candidatus Neomarinimicrobiota bacterium]MBT4957149.1 hypothetical protein [Candidatus Neomarinimicrobiota bacterium]MBT5363045.1 hypothetical protein [Candidatus Neomarinimicrobiota bacterium]MBT6632608.1 hypothetical protein [Candidatus Neomarinimicrobiota bacterium]